MAVGDFLSGLGGVLEQQFGLGENKNKSLDIVHDGTTQRYGKLGDFASQFDQSAERSYTEEGSFRTDFYNQKPKQLDVLLQDPDITVFVKKRAFASLSENFRPDLMDGQEKLFYKATKVLFQNKCRQISSYEKLAKIARIANEIGQVDYYLLPILFSAADGLSEASGAFGSADPTGGLSSFKSIVDRVREVVSLSKDNLYTTWLTNIPNSFATDFGEGTGVIELTNVTQLSTTTSLNFGQGSFSIGITDPYELMLITNNDIEQAISDTLNRFYNNSFIQLGLSSLDDTISVRKRMLNLARIGRGVNPIVFIVEPDSFLGKRVRALVDIVGFEINFDGSITGANTIDPSALQGSAQLGNQGLNGDEVGIFNDIVAAMFTQLSLVINTRRQAKTDNEKQEITYIRKKLRLHYGNKLIVQPMDSVHIYISSKKKIDSKITSGLQSSFSANGFLQGINGITQNLQDSFNVLNGFSLEKSIFVGNDFPNWLWLAMRNQFVADKNGSHVFAGIVEESKSSFSGGFHNVSVNGTDNAGYFNYGIINFKPSSDVFNGSLYDPLTPFNIEFDSVTGVQKDQTPPLLDENAAIFTSAFVKNKNGLLAGTKPTAKNFLVQDAERSQNDSVKKVFYDPDGMVYRWKEGVGTLVLFGDSFTENPIDRQGTPALTDDPFAGQDIMNVLSLLISGEPYNFSTFYKAAIQFDGFKRDPATNEDPAFSYFRNLKNSLKYRNTIYGNFIPFKQLTMDEASFSKILGNQLNATAFDNELQDLLQKRASTADKLIFATKTKQTDTSLLTQYLAGIDTQIQQKIIDINNELQKANKPVKIVGDDISFDYDPYNDPGSKTRLDADARKQLRRKINFLTRRLIWKVRANEDPNLLVIDDTYDKDYDIQAFEKSFTNPNLFKSEYTTVADKIKNVAKILELEVFSNTQGHVEIRNPKYNRMPSSVFHKMFRMKDELGIKVFPQFLEDLYINQIQSLFSEIEVLEDEIRLYCLVLGKSTDDTCKSLINTLDQRIVGSVRIANDSRGNFVFLSDENTGKISGIDFNKLTITANPDLTDVQTKLSQLEPQITTSAFDIATRAAIVQSNVVPPSNLNNPVQFDNILTVLNRQNTPTAQNQRQDQIIARLRNSTGQTFDIKQILGTTTGTLQSLNAVSSLDVLNIVNQISSRLSSRQRSVKTAANALRNIQEGISLTKDKTGANALLYPNLYNSKKIPSVFEHMIEDESYDDLGPGSGARYVIKNHDVMSYSISEKRPPFTAVEVTGRFGDLFIKNSELPRDLDVFQNGNALITASAVDYDLWRMYGIALPQSVDAPFLTDPNSQCAPYAVSLLNRAKKQILSGSIDIVGNEYQQPGEVVYLENRDLLFYVESVSHNFTFGRTFSTSLNVGYGHNPGEYIPTPLDVIGKVLYKNKDITNYVHRKQGNVFNQEHIGTIVGNPNGASFDLTSGLVSIEDEITVGPFGSSNRSTLQKILEYAGTTLSVSSDNYNPVLEVRVYYNTDDAYPEFTIPDSHAFQLAQTVVDYLIGKNDLHGNVKPTGDTSTVSKFLTAFYPNQINVISVDASTSNTGEFRYPSSKAFYYARQSVGKISTGTSNAVIQKKIDGVIYGFVADCWIVFKNPANTEVK